MPAIDIIRCPADAFALFAPLNGEAEERLCAVWLDHAGAILGIRTGAESHMASMPTSDLLREAVACGVVDMIVAHSHPDVRATRRLAEAAQAIGIRLLDHVVVAGGVWTSFRLLGLL